MKNTKPTAPDARMLRQRAEQKLRELPPLAEQPLGEIDARALVHELQVHQTELEMQNEELRRAEAQAQEALDRYADLFDFAPLGYFQLTLDGVIRETNLAGAALLGLDRSQVVSRPFGASVTPACLQAFTNFRKAVLISDTKQTCEIQLLCPGRGARDVQLEGLAEPGQAGLERTWRLAVLDVTLRKQAEAALRVSEGEFRSLAEAMPQIVWATRPDGWNIYFNRQWVDYTGMTMEESHGHGWNTPFHPDDKQRAWEAWQRATQHNERYSLECRLRRADGTYRWWLIRGVPLLGANGEILKWFGTCTDIEDIKRSEALLQQAHDTLEQRVMERTAQLQQNEALLRSITDNSPDPIFLKDRGSRMLLANPATLAVLQKRAEDVLGKTDEEVYDDPAMGRLMMANDRRVMESGQSEVIEELVPGPNGTRTFLSAKTPYRDVEGHVIGIIGVARDITERKRAEAALQDSARLLNDIIDGCGPSAIFLKDRDGKFITINAPLEKMLGMSRDELKGKTDYDLFPKDVADLYRAHDTKVMATAEAIQVEEVSDLPDGHHYFLANKFPLVDADGRLYGVGAISHDITERKRAEETLRFLAQSGSTVSGEDFFQALARHLGQSLGMDYVCIDRLEEGSLTARTVAIYFDGKFEDNVSYALKDTPCGDVVGKTVCCFARDVRNLFPKDAVLQEMVAESYVGVTLWGSQGQPIGLIAVLGRKPLADTRLATSILQVVAGRAAAELERRQAETEIRRHADGLAAANEELTRFNEAMVGRELRMIELKQEVDALCAQLKQPLRYGPEAHGETQPAP